MIANTQPKSLLQETLEVYDRWRAQLPVYLSVLVTSLSTALILDTKFGVSPGRVLLYVLPFTAVLLVLVPFIYAAVKRYFSAGTFAETAERAEEHAVLGMMSYFKMMDTLIHGRSRALTTQSAFNYDVSKGRLEVVSYPEVKLQEMEKELERHLDKAIAESTEYLLHRNQATIYKIFMTQRSIAQGSVSPDVKEALSRVLASLERIKLAQLQELTKQKGVFDVYTEAYTRGTDELALGLIEEIRRFFPDTTDQTVTFTLQDYLDEQARMGNQRVSE